MSQLPVSLEAVGILAGLSRPYSMSQLTSKTIYNSSGNQQTVPAVNISLSLFSNKTFTSPENPLSFYQFYYGTISSNRKVATFTGTTLFGSIYISGGNNIPVYINIVMTGSRQNASVEIGNNGKNIITIGATNVNKSVYLQNGLTILDGINYYFPTSLTVSITNSALYSDLINYQY